MTLFQQIQVFLGSIALGMLFLCIWSLFNAVFYKLKKSIIRLPFETLLFASFVILYHMFLVHICDGIFNIFDPLAIFLGCLIYQKFYARKINPYFDLLIKSLKKQTNKLLMPIKKFYNNNKLKSKRRKKHETKKTT